MTKKNKAQMEILGLAIVVVLVLLATIFVVKFMLFKKPADYRTDFVSSELASNILNAFLKMAAKDCSQLTMTSLLQDCAQGTGLVCENGEDSCKYVENTAKAIFGQTLDKWNLKYHFLACSDFNLETKSCTGSNYELVNIGKECSGDRKLKLFPIPISSRTMYTKLEICE